VGDHRWFKRSTRKKRPVTRDDVNNNSNKVGLIKYIKQGNGNDDDDDDDKNNNIIKVRGQSYATAAPAKYC
jgi:hypothetical protein